MSDPIEPASSLRPRLIALGAYLLIGSAVWILLDAAGEGGVWLKTAIFLGTLFFLLGAGVWVGLALMGVAYVGVEVFTPRPAGDAMITTIWSTASSWTLTALPLFIWMGEILFRTRLSEDMFRGLAPLDGPTAGRIASYQCGGLHRCLPPSPGPRPPL